MNNRIIRIALIDAGLKQWQAARLLGISEAGFSRLLRDEQPELEQERIAKIIMRGNNRAKEEHA